MALSTLSQLSLLGTVYLLEKLRSPQQLSISSLVSLENELGRLLLEDQTPGPSASNDVLSWTNQDPRESVLFNSWGVLYRFQVRVIHQHCFFNSSITFTDYSGSQWAERNNSMAFPSAQ